MIQTTTRTKNFHSAETVEAAWVLNARMDPGDFITYMTGGAKPPARHHLLWLSRMVDPAIARLNLIAPRQSAKTTISEYFLAWYMGHFPWRTNYIVSATRDQAKARLANIKNIILSDRYRNVFPHVRLDTKKPNKEDEFSLWSTRYKDTENLTYNNWVNILQSYHDAKDSTLFATGINSGKVVGRRCSGIALMDDLHDKDNSATELQRQKVINAYLSEIEGTMVPDVGRVISISTRWAESDYPGYIRDLKRSNGEPVWTTIEIAAINRRGESYWSGYWSIKQLNEIREKVGEIWFNCMYMNNPYSLSGEKFTMDMLRKPIPDPLPKFSSIVISVDLASTETKRADYTVMTAIARDSSFPYNMYVLKMKRGKWTIDKTSSILPAFYKKIVELYGRCDKVLVEKQGFQPALMQTIKMQHSYIPFHAVPIKNIPKPERMETVAGIAQAGRLFINQNIRDFPAIVSELVGYGNAQHDDIADTFSLPTWWSEWSLSMEIKSEYYEMEIDGLI